MYPSTLNVESCADSGAAWTAVAMGQRFHTSWNDASFRNEAENESKIVIVAYLITLHRLDSIENKIHLNLVPFRHGEVPPLLRMTRSISMRCNAPMLFRKVKKSFLDVCIMHRDDESMCPACIHP